MWLKLNAAEDEPTADKYGIRVVPTVKILKPDGAELETVEDLSVDGIVTALKRHAK